MVESLRRFHRANEEDGSASESGCTDGTNDHFDYLPRPTASSKDIYDLMLECWRREENERPTFREISLFLQRKNLGYAPTSWYWTVNTYEGYDFFRGTFRSSDFIRIERWWLHRFFFYFLFKILQNGFMKKVDRSRISIGKYVTVATWSATFMSK